MKTPIVSGGTKTTAVDVWVTAAGTLSDCSFWFVLHRGRKNEQSQSEFFYFSPLKEQRAVLGSLFP
jgi:hypothetical protein